MIVHCGLLLMFLSCVRTTEYLYDYGMENSMTEVRQKYSLWPTMHLGLLRKRQAQLEGISEGGASIVRDNPPVSQNPPTAPISKVNGNDSVPSGVNNAIVKLEVSTLAPVNVSTPAVRTNGTAPGKQIDLQDPAVLMRGVIVFGGFLLLAIAYYIFYRKKGSKTDTGNTHNISDGNQFRYGVLHSEDRRDNLELSRVPLTMESDDDDDEDLEIFDLEQRKKSLSYVNLQTNDEELVFPKSSDDRDNLLLDIEDATSDPLINWSSNGNKSIL